MTPRTLRNTLLAAALAAAPAAAGGAAAQTTMGSTMGDMHHHAAAPTPTTHRIEVPDGAHGVALPELGVEIVAVRMSAANTMLDLRYRVLDPAKAKPLMDPAVPMSLIDPGTGAAGEVPVDEQVGALRQSGHHIRPGQVMAALFGNPGGAVRKGSKVNLRLGDLEVVGLAVEG